MKALIAAALVALLGQSTTPSTLRRTFVTQDNQRILYGLSVPPGYDAATPRPLVLALHPGGERTPYYGLLFLSTVVSPALRDLGAVIIAPDCPTRACSDPGAETAVLELVRQIRKEYAIDGRRILVTGFSLGGRGTWFMSARHPDVFTAAIPVAGSSGDEPLDRLGKIPTYVIHSRDDEVVPFAPDERVALELEKLGRPVRFEALAGVSHYNMGAYLPALTRGGRWVEERWKQ